MSFVERLLLYLFANQYCESDFAYLLLLLIMIYVTYTFIDGIIPETAETMYQSQLINQDDPSKSNEQA